MKHMAIWGCHVHTFFAGTGIAGQSPYNKYYNKNNNNNDNDNDNDNDNNNNNNNKEDHLGDYKFTSSFRIWKVNIAIKKKKFFHLQTLIY